MKMSPCQLFVGSVQVNQTLDRVYSAEKGTMLAMSRCGVLYPATP